MHRHTDTVMSREKSDELEKFVQEFGLPTVLLTLGDLLQAQGQSIRDQLRYAEYGRADKLKVAGRCLIDAAHSPVFTDTLG